MPRETSPTTRQETPRVPLPAFSEPTQEYGSGPAVQPVQPPLGIPHPSNRKSPETFPENSNLSQGASGPVLTTNSSIGEIRNPTKEELANAGKLVKGLLAVAVVIAEGLVKRFSKRDLRRPTDDHLDDFSDPVGQILARHADHSKLGPDLLDVTTASAAVGAYLIDGPLTSPRAPESAVPQWWADDTTPERQGAPEPPQPPTVTPGVTPSVITYLD